MLLDCGLFQGAPPSWRPASTPHSWRPGQRGPQARRQPVRDRLRLLQGMGPCAAECPCGAIEMRPGNPDGLGRPDPAAGHAVRDDPLEQLPLPWMPWPQATTWTTNWPGWRRSCLHPQPRGQSRVPGRHRPIRRRLRQEQQASSWARAVMKAAGDLDAAAASPAGL